MGRIEISDVPVKSGTTYPAPHDKVVDGRSFRALGAAGGLTQFGVNLVTLQPGAAASLRHWHLNEDEFLWMTAGELVLVEDQGETVMRAGDCAAFPAGVANGHHMVNRSGAEASFLVIGTDSPDEVCTYSDVDMKVTTVDGVSTFTRRDGSALPEPGA